MVVYVLLIVCFMLPLYVFYNTQIVGASALHDKEVWLSVHVLSKDYLEIAAVHRCSNMTCPSSRLSAMNQSGWQLRLTFL